jgi:hypothetical protein
MSPGELKAWLKREPFLPVRLHMTDHSTFEVRHPEWIMVGFSTAVVGTRRDPSSEIYDEPILLKLSQITRVEPLALSPSTQS